MDKACNKKVGFFQVTVDMLRLVGIQFWIIAFGSFLGILFIVLYFKITVNPCKLPRDLISVIPELMGFLIAGLAIVMGFNEQTLKRLSKTADDGKIPIRVIVANFTFCFMILLFTLLGAIVYSNIQFCCTGSRRLYGVFLLWGAILSALSLFNIMFHLFATSTHLINKE